MYPVWLELQCEGTIEISFTTLSSLCEGSEKFAEKNPFIKQTDNMSQFSVSVYLKLMSPGPVSESCHSPVPTLRAQQTYYIPLSHFFLFEMFLESE